MTLSKAEQLARAEKQFAEARAKVKKLRKQHQITIMKTKLRQQTQDIARLSAENKAKDTEIAKLKEQLANIGRSTEAVPCQPDDSWSLADYTSVVLDKNGDEIKNYDYTAMAGHTIDYLHAHGLTTARIRKVAGNIARKNNKK